MYRLEFSPGRTVLDGLPEHKLQGLHKANPGLFEPNTIECIRYNHIFTEVQNKSSFSFLSGKLAYSCICMHSSLAYAH